MAYYLLGSSGGSCCPTCPPPGTCGCFQDCGTCTPDTTLYDSDCGVVLDDLGNPVDVTYGACATPTTTWTNWETDHPAGGGWTTLYACESCPCSSDGSSNPVFIQELLPESTIGLYEVEFIALTAQTASVNFNYINCECPDIVGAEQTWATVQSSGAVVGSTTFPVTREQVTPSCPWSMQVVCNNIPADCCGWKLAVRRTDFSSPGVGCDLNCLCIQAGCGEASDRNTIYDPGALTITGNSGTAEVSTSSSKDSTNFTFCASVAVTPTQWATLSAEAEAISGPGTPVYFNGKLNPSSGGYLCPLDLSDSVQITGPGSYSIGTCSGSLVCAGCTSPFPVDLFLSFSTTAGGLGTLNGLVTLDACAKIAYDTVECGSCSYSSADVSSFSDFTCDHGTTNCVNKEDAETLEAWVSPLDDC